MALELDPELRAAVDRARLSGAVPTPPSARDDWSDLRGCRERVLASAAEALPPCSEVRRSDITTLSIGGAEIRLRWFCPPDVDQDSIGSVVVYLHGGGMVLGSVDLFDRRIASYVAESKVPFLGVDYRLAPENPHPAPVEDCFAGLVWVHQNSAKLGVDENRVGVMGDSGGGGLAAAVAILARRRGVEIAAQILIGPMLDDRTTSPDPLLVPFAKWTYDDNFTGWHALLGDAIGSSLVPSTAAPARETDLSNLPKAYIEVGELDIFREECIQYASRLASAGTPVELHVHRGCPHGFERLDPNAAISRRARADRLRVISEI